VHHVYKLFSVRTRERLSCIETDEVAFFVKMKFQNSLSARCASQLTRIFQHYRHPDWPTDFDTVACAGWGAASVGEGEGVSSGAG